RRKTLRDPGGTGRREAGRRGSADGAGNILGCIEGMTAEEDLKGRLPSGRQAHATPYRAVVLLPAVATMVSLLGLCLAWSLVARTWPNPALPAPTDVWRVLVKETASGELVYHL